MTRWFSHFDKKLGRWWGFSQSQGCQAGSIRQRLSWLLAAATRVLTLLSTPSKVARAETVFQKVPEPFTRGATACLHYIPIFDYTVGSPLYNHEETKKCLCHQDSSAFFLCMRTKSWELWCSCYAEIRLSRVCPKGILLYNLRDHCRIEDYARAVFIQPGFSHATNCLMAKCCATFCSPFFAA